MLISASVFTQLTSPHAPLCHHMAFLRGEELLDLGHALILYDTILTNYICEDPIFKQDHILRFKVDKNLR